MSKSTVSVIKLMKISYFVIILLSQTVVRIFSREPFFYTVRYSFPLFYIFPNNRKARRTEVLRVSYVWTQRYLTITIYIIMKSTPQCNPRFRFAPSRSGIHPINSSTNVLVRASSHRPLFYEFALLIANRILLDDCSNTS